MSAPRHVGLLSRPLRRGHQIDSHGSTAAGDRVGVPDGVGSVVGGFGVLIDDDHGCGHVRRRFPGALAPFGEERGAGFEDLERVSQ